MSSGEGKLQSFLTALASFPSGTRLPKAFPAGFTDLQWSGAMSVTGMGTRDSCSFCPLTRSQHSLCQCPWLPVLYIPHSSAPHPSLPTRHSQLPACVHMGCPHGQGKQTSRQLLSQCNGPSCSTPDCQLPMNTQTLSSNRLLSSQMCLELAGGSE